MAVLSGSVAMVKIPETRFLSGSLSKPMDKCFLKISSSACFPGSSVRAKATHKLPLVVQASGDAGRQNSGNIFIGGFVLGGLVVGALGCLYAPQISRTLAAADSTEIMKKLPKFIYDEEKALERTRKMLSEKIAELNSAIDGVSAQLRAEEPTETDGYAARSEEVEASV
ncbi:uncharacterized protein LOC107641623 [Arachis ipaensis]|uniref:uncharacterized protein LOC107641623 n=1 Tax=Arachis ipaensis TaxID=130454 RepID=UPI0007AEFB42|nr:uncharacterized protein LOC107641623 [Arachis ipaensis]